MTAANVPTRLERRGGIGRAWYPLYAVLTVDGLRVGTVAAHGPYPRTGRPAYWSATRAHGPTAHLVHGTRHRTRTAAVAALSDPVAVEALRRTQWGPVTP